MKDSFSGNNKGRKEALGELTALQFISLLDLVRFLKRLQWTAHTCRSIGAPY